MVIILVLGTTLYFTVQSYNFQTWLGEKVSGYFEDELHTTVAVKKVHLDFFKTAQLEGILIRDKHNDTILFGDVFVDITDLNYEKQSMHLKKITLKNINSKLIQYKNDSTLNYQFLIDYFTGTKKDTVAKKGWDIKFGDIILDNVSFVYRNENHDQTVSKNMNFSNLSFKSTYGKLTGIDLKDDDITVNLIGIRTKEQCGFELKNLTSQTHVSSKQLNLKRLFLRTEETALKGEINFEYEKWDDYSDFINKINIRSELINSYLCFKDVAAFTSELNGLNETVYLSGNIKGYVNDIKLSDFTLRYRKNTTFNGNLTLTGLPDIKNSFLHFDAKNISANYYDLILLPNYPFNEGKKLELPAQLKSLGTIYYKGKFDGFVTDFTTYGNFKTALGSVSTDLSIKLGEKADDMKYRGKIKMKHFNVGALAGIKNLKDLSLDIDVKGKGVSIKNINTQVEGNIHNLNYNNYVYHNITLKGVLKEKVFNGLLLSKDPNADFDFDGKINFKNKIPELDFISTVNHVNLKALNFTSEESSFSTQILIVLKGDNINNITGGINFDNTIYANASKKFKISTFDVQLQQETADKKIDINSSYFNIGIGGKFNITNLPVTFNHFLSSYYPAFVQKIKTKTVYTDAFKFNIKIKKFNTISELFVKKLMVSPGTTIGGDFDATKNLFNLTLQSDSVRYGGIVFHKNVIESYSQNNKINLVFKGSDIQLTDSIRLNNYFMYLVSKDKDTKYNFEWNNKTVPNNTGRIAGKVSFGNPITTFNFDKFFITANDSTWNLMTLNPAVLDTSGRFIVNPLLFANNEQKIGIAGVLSSKPEDSLLVQTENVVLEQFNPILKEMNVDLEGILSGSVTIFNSNSFAFNSNLDFKKFKINKNLLGHLVLKTEFNAKKKDLFLDGYTSLGLMDDDGNETKNISFKGYYYMDEREENIDIDFAASPANLKLLNPLMEGILTIKDAYVNGEGKIHGSTSNIKIDGNFKLFNSEIKIDYTNVTYNITGGIEIMPDQIRFSDLLMREKGNKAVPQGTINGNIFHDKFSKMQLDYDITYNNMLVMNTTEKENKSFYGKLYGTGNIGIWGFLNNLHMQIIDTTNKNSKFYLPLDGPAEVEESDFIHFVKKDTVKLKKDDRLSGFALEMFVNATPDVMAQIILDKKTGDILNVQGLGDLTLRINTLGKFEMIGDYFITNGDYRFTLENVINKKFEIDAGSSISWSGDPLAADINIITSYRQRASVAPLLNDTTGAYKARVPVDCKLKITDKLFSPNIKLGVEFPTIDATARARIDNLLSDEMELNRQVFSFLLFRSFVTPQIYNANSGGVTAGNAAASTGSELLSNQVSSFLNSYVGNITGLSDLQLGLNYRPGTQTNSEAVDLALSKQLFNNKVSIDGNFGVNNNNANRNSSGVIDVNIEYKLTDDGRYRVKGFNRSNDNTQIAATGGPFTQGIGLFYREEFETFNQLFNRYLDKLKKKESKPN